MQSFSDNAKCARAFCTRGVCCCFFLSVCTRGTAQRCQDASRYPFVQLRERKKDLSQCSAYLYVSHTACDLFIYLLFNYSLRLSVYAVFWLPGVQRWRQVCVCGASEGLHSSGWHSDCDQVLLRCTIPQSSYTAQQGRRCSREHSLSTSSLYTSILSSCLSLICSLMHSLKHVCLTPTPPIMSS